MYVRRLPSSVSSPLPAKLTSLDLGPDDTFTDAEINGVLTALAGLPLLSQLCLDHIAFAAQQTAVQLSLLAACPSLTDLELQAWNAAGPSLTPSLLDQIRSSFGHLDRLSVGLMETDDLARLLRPPSTARWRDIGYVRADERTGELLLRLPFLTKLDLLYGLATAHVDFLSQPQLLTSLQLDCYKPGDDEADGVQQAWFIPAGAVAASLVMCTGLTQLDLDCLNSAQWTALFAKLTKLKKFELLRGGTMETLQCFAAGPTTESLEELIIRNLELPPPEVSHLYALRRLHALELECCFSTRLDDATIALLSPPSALLPALTKFTHTWRIADREWDYVERQGPSFEWTQQRLAQ